MWKLSLRTKLLTLLNLISAKTIIFEIYLLSLEKYTEFTVLFAGEVIFIIIMIIISYIDESYDN